LAQNAVFLFLLTYEIGLIIYRGFLNIMIIQTLL